MFISCFYAYILICLQCNFFIYFFRVSLLTNHFVYIVISLHCFFRVSMFTYYFVYFVISLHSFFRVSIVYIVIFVYVLFVFLSLHIILVTL